VWVVDVRDFDVLVVVAAAGVVVPLSGDELLLVLEPVTTIRNAMSTAISAKGARKRAGLLLVR
jgi:hypothetical protein